MELEELKAKLTSVPWCFRSNAQDDCIDDILAGVDRLTAENERLKDSLADSLARHIKTIQSQYSSK